MSNMFICGESGCDCIDIDDSALIRASLKRKEWAQKEFHRTGNYPSANRQNDYFAAAYQRFTSNKIVKGNN